MIKRKLFILASIIGGSTLIMYGLSVYSSKYSLHRNPFKRNIVAGTVATDTFINLRFNSYYIAGISEAGIFLGSLTAPSLIRWYDHKLANQKQIKIRLAGHPKVAIEKIKIIVNFPYLFVTDQMTGSVFRCILPDSICLPFEKLFPEIDNLTPVSENSFILKSYDPILKQTVIGKKNKSTPIFFPNPPILQKQLDGVFCTDGELIFSAKLKSLVYVYLYRNQFLYIDTNLTILYKGKTLDTNSVAKLNIDTINSIKALTYLTPPLLINTQPCVDSNRLFIHSTLLSSNENIVHFKNASVIDCYSLKNGNYLYSFYLPDFNNTKVENFTIYRNRLFALYGQFLVAFHFQS